MAMANMTIDVMNVPEVRAVIDAARKVVYVSGIHLDELRTALEALPSVAAEDVYTLAQQADDEHTQLVPALPPNGPAPEGGGT